MPRKSKEESSSKTANKSAKPRAKAKTNEKPKAEKTVRTKTASAATKEPSSKKSILPTRKTPTRTKKSPTESAQVKNVPEVKKGTRSRLPRYGQTQLVAFVRDPNCIFTYWEVTPETVEEVRRQLMDEYEGSSMVLRVLLRSKPDGTSELLEEIIGQPGRNEPVRQPGRSGRQLYAGDRT